MKKLFEILQKPWCLVILGIIFLGVPKWTVDFGPTATWVILVASTIVLLLVLWYLFAKWQVTSRGYLVANSGAAFTGIVSSLVIFAYIYGGISKQELNLFLLLSFCSGITIFLWGIFSQWFTKPWDEDGGQPSPLPKTRPSVVTDEKALPS